MVFTENTKIDELCRTSEMKGLAPYMVYCGSNKFPEFFNGHTIESKCKMDGWNLPAVLNGLNFTAEQRMTGGAEIYHLYSERQVKKTEMENVNIIRFVPEKTDVEKPYVVLCAGGGYKCVCSMIEAYPTAAQLVERGYQVFVLTYRVTQFPILENALKDLAQAIRYVDKHAEVFGIKAGNYVVGGFSAGANLAGNWGTEIRGYKQFGFCKPKALFLVYAPVEFIMPGEKEENNFLIHVDQSYPPSYLVCGKDDKIVSSRNSEVLYEKLCENKVKSFFEEGNHAPHGFGDGTGTDVQGWPMRAADFLEKLEMF